MANEKRLIDANTLYEELSTLSMVVTGLRAGKGVLNEFMKQYRESVLRIVDEQATVDAVEVVRCKDCVHMKKQFNGRFCDVWCLYNGDGDEGFCNYGERRTEDG